jgi:glycosyltransferase involved in cell wall biosynthesis
VTTPLRIAAFGFRSLPPRAGAAGADKFALEMFTRLAAAGHHVVAYSRVYPDQADEVPHDFHGVRVIPFRTVGGKGFDTLLHSARATWDIIRHNRADIVHIQNGGNSIFAIPLRLAGKRTFLSQDGVDWERAKWPWYAKLYLWLSQFVTAHVHTGVIFDNVFAQDAFEKKFRRHYTFIPFGADVHYDGSGEAVLDELRLEKDGYFLFVGRFIRDKGLQYLIPAFQKLKTDKKLVLVGGSPNPSPFEAEMRAAAANDKRIVFPGYVYGARTHALMKHAYAYIQPSDVEGLSPVILEAAYLGAPIICSDIVQNKYAMREAARYFRASDTDDLAKVLDEAVRETADLKALAVKGQSEVERRFSWNNLVAAHVRVFRGAPASATIETTPA